MNRIQPFSVLALYRGILATRGLNRIQSFSEPSYCIASHYLLAKLVLAELNHIQPFSDPRTVLSGHYLLAGRISHDMSLHSGS